MSALSILVPLYTRSGQLFSQAAHLHRDLPPAGHLAAPLLYPQTMVLTQDSCSDDEQHVIMGQIWPIDRALPGHTVVEPLFSQHAFLYKHIFTQER